MKTNGIKKLMALATMLVAGLILSCEGAANEPAPVDLVAAWEEPIHVLDFNDPECPGLGTISLRAIPKGTATNPAFLDVQLEAYRVSYRRRDGGTLVPASFTRTVSMLIPAGGGAVQLGSFLAFEPGALNQAPFAALFPINGGIDPETGGRSIDMDLIIDFYGETLSGEEVTARAQTAITFCAGCGGCV
jgi:hypothetical protein